MANEREVKLKISALAVGGDKIQNLTNEINELVKQGSDASPVFDKLSKEFQELSQQNQLLNKFVELRSGLKQLTEQFQQSAQETNKAATALRQSEQSFKQVSDAQERSSLNLRKHNEELKSLGRESTLVSNEINRLGLELKKENAETESLLSQISQLKSKKVDLSDSIVRLKSETSSLVEAQKESYQAFQQSQSSMQRAARHFDEAKENSQQLKESLRETNKKLFELSDSMQKAGVSTNNLQSQYSSLSIRTRELADSLEKEKKALMDKAEADRQLAASAKLANESYLEKVAVLKSELNLQKQLTANNQASIESELALARANQESIRSTILKKGATEANIRVSELEGQLSKNKIQGLRLEADIEMKLIDAKHEYVTATNTANAATSNEIRAQQLAVQTKLEYAAASERALIHQKSFADSADKTNGISGKLTSSIKSVVGSFAALYGVFEGVSAFVRVNVELENIEKTMRVVFGSSQAMRKEMEFVKDLSNRLGLELVSTAKSYSQFAAATKGTALAGEQTRIVFESVSRAMANAGRTSAETEGALNALGQMVSKGVVQMEELRGQLGDRLPGAMKVAADSLGLTTQDLIKMIESGKVLAQDLLPKLAVGLDSTFKESKDSISTTTQEFNRLKNAISETFRDVGESGFLKGLVKIGAAVSGLVASIGAAFNFIGKTIGDTLAAGQANFEAFLGFLKTLDFSSLFRKLADNAKIFTDSISSSFNSAAETANRFIKLLTGEDEKVKTSQTNIQSSLKKTGDAAQHAGEQITKAGNAAGNSSKGWLEITNEIETSTKALKDDEVALRKSIEARAEEVSLSKELLSIRGDEVASLGLILESSEKEAQAKKLLTANLENHINLLIQELYQKQALIASGAVEGAERQKQIEVLKKEIDVQGAKLDVAKQQLAASEVAIIRAREEAASYRDNSKSIDALKHSYESLKSQLSDLNAKKSLGLKVDEEILDKTKELAESSAMYRDSVRDTQAAIQATLEVKHAENNLAQLVIRSQIESAKADYEVAKAKGDESGARRAANEVRRLEIELAKLQAQMLRAEAEATLEMIKVKREEAIARGEMTRQLEMELRAQELNAQAKQKQAEIQDITAQKLDRLNYATNESVGSMQRSSSAANDNANAINNLANSYDRAANSARNMSNAQGSAKRVSPVNPVQSGSNGWSDKSSFGEGGVAPDGKIKDLLWDFDRGGKRDFTEEEKRMAEAAYEAARNNLEVMQKTKGGFSLEGQRSVIEEYNKALRLVTIARGEGGFDDENLSEAARGDTRTYNVNIDFAGKRKTKIKVASEKDAEELKEAFKYIGATQSRS